MDDSHHCGAECSVPVDWYEGAFGELYDIVYAHRTVSAALPEAVFAARVTALSSLDRGLDLCCGTGRHLVGLLHSGARLTGFDYSEALLQKARENTSREMMLIRGDMRALPFPESFTVVFSFFTSFGYFMEEQENKRSLVEMSRVLVPGGRFFFDYFNAPYLRSNLISNSVREYCPYSIYEHRWIDDVSKRINKSTVVTRNGETVGMTSESVRMYHYDELTAMMTSVGLKVNQVWGGYDGAPYGPSSSRMLLLGSKKCP